MSQSNGTIQFEARKVHLKQDKNGHVLSLAIHPNDTPEALWRTPSGQPYMVVMAPFLDPEEGPEADEGRTALAHMRATCKKPEFQSWLRVAGEAAAVEAVKRILQIQSSTAIRDSQLSLTAWRQLYDGYRNGFDPPL